MAANDKMRWLFVGVLFLFTFNLIFCSPILCPLCSKGANKTEITLEDKPESKSETTTERPSESKTETKMETKTENKTQNKREVMNQEIPEIRNFTEDVNRYSEWKLFHGDITKNTIERPEYSNNVEPRVGNPLYLKNNEMEKNTTNMDEHFINFTKNCVGCENGSLGFKKHNKHIGCICALFTTSSPFVDDLPLISKTFHNVSCHHPSSEEDTCTNACLSLALSYYKVRDNIICSHAHNATNLTASLHTKVCGDKNKWTFTGLSTNKPICCNMGKSIKCKNTEIKYGASEFPNFPPM